MHNLLDVQPKIKQLNTVAWMEMNSERLQETYNKTEWRSSQCRQSSECKMIKTRLPNVLHDNRLHSINFFNVRCNTIMPVSHRAYGLYGQTRTVNAYAVRSPKNLPQIRSHTVSAYGLHGQLARSLRSRTVARTACTVVRTVSTVARTVSTVGRTVYTVSCYGQPERYK